MKISHKIALLIVVMIAFSIRHLNAQAKVDGAYVDSLQKVLGEVKTPSDQIPLLKELANVYWQQPEEVEYIRKVIQIASQLDSIDLVYAGMAGLCRYYYNQEQGDSLMFWKNQIDSVSEKRSERPIAFYRVGNLLCRHYQGNHNYELAINEAIALVNDAKKRKDDNGLMIAYQSLGFVYQGLGRDSDAVVAYREGLGYLNKLGVSSSYEMQYLSEMIQSCLLENLQDETEQLLIRYTHLYKTLCLDYEKKGMTYPVSWHHWLIDSYFAELYIRKGQTGKAGTYLKKADRYAEESTDEVMKYQYYRIRAMYYLTIKDYKTALQAINKALKVEVQPDILKLKIDILRADGQKVAAMSLFDELLTLNTKISNDAFSRQVQQLRNLNVMNEHKERTYELQHQSEQLAMKQQLLLMAMSTALLLVISLSLLFRYYLRTRKLKNALQCDKDSLIESEQQLRMAKEKAEEANLLKTAFISNISHEVRTPLNAIVGFSRLLGDTEGDYTEEEKKSFTDIISKNSDLLLHLVNDVLDLSRLESGKVKLSIKPCDIIASCREVMGDIFSLLNPDVRFVFEPPIDSYILNTDILRFKQVMEHLLRNAAKFTKEGEIILSILIDEEKRQVQLHLSDTGCGIPTEMQYKIFDCFEKLDEFSQGTGLGLPICLKIANLVKGDLYIDPDYTAGARFVFIHPIGLVNE